MVAQDAEYVEFFISQPDEKPISANVLVNINNFAIYVLYKIHKSLAEYGLSTAGKNPNATRSVDRLIENTPQLTEKEMCK